jgi:molecular chaperone DnaK
VVAVGAAIQGAALVEHPTSRHHAPLALLLDVTPRTLGVATVGGFTSVVIPRNSQLPTDQTRVFTTSADYQDTVSIKVCQGESKKFSQNTLLGMVQLDGLRPAARGETKVEVTFEIDTDGILRVEAKDLDTGRRQNAAMRLVGVSDGADARQDVGEMLDEVSGRPQGLPEA